MRREETVDHNIKTTWYAIARMYNQQASKHELTMSMGFVLLNIDAKEGTPATKIAPLMGLEARSLTRLLKTMEQNGLIQKKSVPTDRRLVKIFLTKEGKQKKEKSKDVVLKFNNTVREHIGHDKLKVFFEVLDSINQLIDEEKIYK